MLCCFTFPMLLTAVIRKRATMWKRSVSGSTHSFSPLNHRRCPFGWEELQILSESHSFWVRLDGFKVTRSERCIIWRGRPTERHFFKEEGKCVTDEHFSPFYSRLSRRLNLSGGGCNTRESRCATVCLCDGERDGWRESEGETELVCVCLRGCRVHVGHCIHR